MDHNMQLDVVGLLESGLAYDRRDHMADQTEGSNFGVRFSRGFDLRVGLGFGTVEEGDRWLGVESGGDGDSSRETGSGKVAAERLHISREAHG
ncbi:hypothetical protein M5K25_016420 [Dendrobium thyrsiflorum]|uniref:Uncharacterized protein n=1 Tax=Dendrobium thyrsiflorum TaxID=117978 RepID=A0ABD0UK74_DENTH